MREERTTEREDSKGRRGKNGKLRCRGNLAREGGKKGIKGRIEGKAKRECGKGR